jgi:GT2 family glycosyltransferase
MTMTGKPTAGSTRVSAVVPCLNGAGTIEACVSALAASAYPIHEIIVVDDGSTDGSADLAEAAGARVIRLSARAGASAARNAGVKAATGELIFFTDADCVARPDAVGRAVAAWEPGTVVGGTYSPRAHDPGFFNHFQAAFVHYSETKAPEPDYVATHAMLIERATFMASGGFDEGFMPIIEDVEMSHRLRAGGIRLVMAKGVEVEHVFGFTLAGSMRNAWRKARYWTRYSMDAGDLHRDSGTASIELKGNVVAWAGMALMLGIFALTSNLAVLVAAGFVQGGNLMLNREFIGMLMRQGAGFGARAALYYLLVYPVPVGMGGIAGLFTRGGR